MLIAVFPYLDFLIAGRSIRETSQLGNGVGPIDMGSVKRISAMLVVMCLVSAIVLMDKPSRDDTEGEED